MQAVRAFAVTAVCVAGCTSRSMQQGTVAVRRVVSWGGWRSGVREARSLRITNWEDWSTLWREHAKIPTVAEEAAALGIAAPPGLVGAFPRISGHAPFVDFSRYELVAVFTGRSDWPFGFSPDVNDKGDCIDIRMRRGGAQILSLQDRAWFSHYWFVVLPKSKKEVCLLHMITGEKGEPVEWGVYKLLPAPGQSPKQ